MESKKRRREDASNCATNKKSTKKKTTKNKSEPKPGTDANVNPVCSNSDETNSQVCAE